MVLTFCGLFYRENVQEKALDAPDITGGKIHNSNLVEQSTQTGEECKFLPYSLFLLPYSIIKVHSF